MNYLTVFPMDVHVVPFEAAGAGTILGKLQGEAADLQGVVRGVGNALLKCQAKIAVRYVGPERLDLQVAAAACTLEKRSALAAPMETLVYSTTVMSADQTGSAGSPASAGVDQKAMPTNTIAARKANPDWRVALKPRVDGPRRACNRYGRSRSRLMRLH